jgi:hypothetical protein
MTRTEFVAIVTPLTLRLKNPLDTVEWKLLHESLDDLGPQLLQAAVHRAARTRKWFPRDVEFREDAEACRLEMRAALKFEPCAECETSPGYRPVGKLAVERCPCWHAHQAKVASLGVGSKPLALPPADRSLVESEG